MQECDEVHTRHNACSMYVAGSQLGIGEYHNRLNSRYGVPDWLVTRIVPMTLCIIITIALSMCLPSSVGTYRGMWLHMYLCFCLVHMTVYPSTLA